MTVAFRDKTHILKLEKGIYLVHRSIKRVKPLHHLPLNASCKGIVQVAIFASVVIVILLPNFRVKVLSLCNDF